MTHIEKQKVYIVLDLESSNKDCVWGVYATLKLAENNKKSLIENSVDKDRLLFIIEENVEIK